MERKTIEKEGEKKIEYRYFISSLVADIENMSRAVRGHWIGTNTFSGRSAK